MNILTLATISGILPIINSIIQLITMIYVIEISLELRAKKKGE